MYPPETVNQICERYSAGESGSALAREFGIAPVTVYDWLHRRGIAVRSGRDEGVLTQAQSEAICARYLSGETSPAIARSVGTTEVTVRNHLKWRGISRRPCWLHSKRYECNHEFFRQIDSEPAAYWLGFLAADGYVHPDGRGAVVVKVGLQDRDHLYRLAAALESSHPVREYHYPYASFAHLYIRSAGLTTDLGRHGVTPAKTFTLRWPALPEQLLPHFLRGYVDGDGGFYAHGVKGTSYIRHSFSLTSNRPFIEAAQGFLMRRCDLRRTRLKEYKNPSTVSLEWGGRLQVLRIAELLYRDATVYLPRKKTVMLP